MATSTSTEQLSLGNRKCVLFAFVLFVSLGLALCNPKMTFKNMICDEFNPKFLVYVNCSLKPVKRFVTLLNYETFLRNSVNDVNLKMTVNAKVGTVYSRYILEIKENFCDILGGRKFAPIFSLVLNQIRNGSSLTHPCPYDGRFYIHNAVVDLKHMPMVLPQGEYKAMFQSMEGKNLMGSLSIHFLIS